MSATSLRERRPQGNRFMTIFGAVILAGVVLYFVFMAIDGFGLESRQGAARVTGKEYREADTTYTTQVIGGTTRSIPHTTGEMYILALDIEGHETQAAVTKELYSISNRGDRIQVTYQQRRLTGALQVVEIPSPRRPR